MFKNRIQNLVAVPEKKLVQLYSYDVADPSTPLDIIGEPVEADVAAKAIEFYDRIRHIHCERIGALSSVSLLLP